MYFMINKKIPKNFTTFPIEAYIGKNIGTNTVKLLQGLQTCGIQSKFLSWFV